MTAVVPRVAPVSASWIRRGILCVCVCVAGVQRRPTALAGTGMHSGAGALGRTLAFGVVCVCVCGSSRCS